MLNLSSEYIECDVRSHITKEVLRREGQREVLPLCSIAHKLVSFKGETSQLQLALNLIQFGAK